MYHVDPIYACTRQVGIVEYGYKPVLGDVPEFNLPSVLPDLPMVADISWNSADMPGFTPIAPSTKNVMAELPDITPGKWPSAADKLSILCAQFFAW